VVLILLFETLKTLKLPPFLRISPKPASLDHAIPVKTGIAGKSRLYKMRLNMRISWKQAFGGKKPWRKPKEKIEGQNIGGSNSRSNEAYRIASPLNVYITGLAAHSRQPSKPRPFEEQNRHLHSVNFIYSGNAKWSGGDCNSHLATTDSTFYNSSLNICSSKCVFIV